MLRWPYSPAQSLLWEGALGSVVTAPSVPVTPPCSWAGGSGGFPSVPDPASGQKLGCLSMPCLHRLWLLVTGQGERRLARSQPPVSWGRLSPGSQWQEIPPAPHPFPGRDLFFCLFSWLWVSPCAVGVHRAAALPPVAEDTTLLRVQSQLFAFSRQPVPQAHPEGPREARERGP